MTSDSFVFWLLPVGVAVKPGSCLTCCGDVVTQHLIWLFTPDALPDATPIYPSLGLKIRNAGLCIPIGKCGSNPQPCGQQTTISTTQATANTTDMNSLKKQTSV